jgi:hypothetical protein
MAKATVARGAQDATAARKVLPTPGVLLAYKPANKKAVQAKAALKTTGRPRQAIAAAR